jgi:hypothetical protein
MEKFNLERALAGEPVITRDGREVTRLVKFEADREGYPLMGVLDENVRSWTIDGRFATFSENSPKDLFMKPKENAIWVNVYKREDGSLYIGGIYNNEQEAQNTKFTTFSNYIKTVKITES